MNTVTLDPARLPALDIITLAQSGILMRAERETSPDGVPVFLTQEGWMDLHERRPSLGLPELQLAVEKATRHLMTHAAETVATQKPDAAPGLFICPSDFFEENGNVHIVFVRDIAHPVVCAVIGTREHIRHILSITEPEES